MALTNIHAPPVIVRVHSAPEELGDGDTMDFTMWMGPLPVHWVAQIEAVKRILELTKFDRVFEMKKSTQEAVASFHE